MNFELDFDRITPDSPGRETGPVEIHIDGDRDIGLNHINLGRSILGQMKDRMAFQNLKMATCTVKVEEKEPTVTITVQSNRYGLADIDKMLIQVGKKAGGVKDIITGFIARVSVDGRIPLILNIKEPGMKERNMFPGGFVIESNYDIAVDGFALLNSDEFGEDLDNFRNHSFKYPSGINADLWYTLDDWYGFKQFRYYTEGYDPLGKGEHGYKMLTPPIPAPKDYNRYWNDWVIVGKAIEDTAHVFTSATLKGYKVTAYGHPWESQEDWPLTDEIWAALNDGIDPIGDCQDAANALGPTFNSDITVSYGISPTCIMQNYLLPTVRYLTSDYKYEKGKVELHNILDNRTHEMIAVYIPGKQKYHFPYETKATDAEWTATPGTSGELYNHLNLEDGLNYIIIADLNYTDSCGGTYNVGGDWEMTTPQKDGDYKVEVYNQMYKGVLTGCDFKVDLLLFGSEHFQFYSYEGTLKDGEEQADIVCQIHVGEEMDYIEGQDEPFIMVVKKDKNSA